ncbi:MAG: hypothetical protein ACOY3K_07180 [Candidatus Omnitrophota bacterium]
MKEALKTIWRIGEILVRKKRIEWEGLEESLQEQRRTQERLGEILMRKKQISQPLFYQALAEQYGLEFVDLKRVKINPEAVKKIPRSVALKYTLLPIEISGEGMILGIADPLRDWPAEELRNLAKVKSVRRVLCIPEDLRASLDAEYAKIS